MFALQALGTSPKESHLLPTKIGEISVDWGNCFLSVKIFFAFFAFLFSFQLPAPVYGEACELTRRRPCPLPLRRGLIGV